MPKKITWTNWAGNQTCTAQIKRPKNKQELINVVLQAKNENKKIRAFGSKHSWSDIVCVSGYLIDTSRLHNIISVDLKKHQVTVEAGIKLSDLNKKLQKLNLCLSNQGAITKQSLAGAVSTATHGSGKTGTLASFIVSAEMINANGEIVTVSNQKNKKYFSAIRASVGSLGIFTELTVQCEPLFKVKREEQQLPWDYFIKNYEKLYRENDYIEFEWQADTDQVYTKIHNKISNEKPEKNKSKSKNIDYSYKLLSGVLNEIYVEIEIAIPRDKFVLAAQNARQLIREKYKKNKAYNAILFRFVSAEQNMLISPAAEQDVVYFSLVPDTTTGYLPFFKKYFELLFNFGGRPHWGKINFLTRQDAHKLYGKNFEQFVKIRKELDPEGLFSNRFTQKIFGW